MIEIASPSSFPSVAEPVPPGQRDTKTRSGSVPTVPFGSLVSQAAHNRQRPAGMQDGAPTPRTPTAEEEARATARREAREGVQQSRQKPAQSAEDAARVPQKAQRHTEGRKEDGSGDVSTADASLADDATQKPARAETCDDQTCPETAGEQGKAETTEQSAGAEVASETVEATVDTVVPALALPTIGEALEPAVAVPVPGAAVMNGENSAIASGAARAAAMMAETPAAAVLTTLVTGEIPAGDAEMPTGSKGSADLIALMQARTGETAANAALRADQAAPAAEVSKVNFADWINEFALAQGAMHRSGDLVGSLDRALATIPTPHAGQDALRPTPLQMLPIEIGMQAMRGVKTFQIRLDPAELGRVDVKLEFKEDGEVKASLVVDRVETLAMLKRDAPTLQQAFEQAGLRQSPDGLSFQLRGEQQGRDGQRENGAEGKPDRAGDSEEAGVQRPAEFVMRRVMIPNSSLDLVV
jgi:flagellar hook-length control protein FliK